MTVHKHESFELSPHFNSDEFDCKGEDCCKSTIVSPVLIERLEEMRELIDRPIKITSGYRCRTHNKRVGGAVHSQHVQGTAADIQVIGMTPKQLSEIAMDVGFRGIGIAENFLHVDVRATHLAIWTYPKRES